MPVQPKQPQDRRPPARKSTANSRARQQKADEEELDRGLALTDDDGTRLEVRIRDVKGSHDRALIDLIGVDFVGLLEKMSQRQGADLLAALLWFARLVNGRDPGDYEALLDEIGYADYLTRDIDQPPRGERKAPKASVGN